MNDRKKKNPLGMQLLTPEGPYVLPQTRCSRRRRAYFQRAHRILTSHPILAFYSDKGHEWMQKLARQEGFSTKTKVRFRSGSRVRDSNYGYIRKMFKPAKEELTNQSFLMVYGNFEAFVMDLVYDGLSAQGASQPMKETVSLMMASKWCGKIDRISQKLGLKLGKSVLVNRFKDLPVEFAGVSYEHPLKFLEKVAEVRHCLVHSVGSVHAQFATDHPEWGLSEGERIRLPLNLPSDMYYFFVLLTDVIDQAFAERFGWPRPLESLEKLV